MTGQEENIPDERMHSILRMAGLAALNKAGELSPDEQEEVQEWLQQDPIHLHWWEQLSSTEKVSGLLAEFEKIDAGTTEALQRFHEEHFEMNKGTEPVRSVPLYKRWWVAASILLLLIAGTWLWIGNKSGQQSTAGKTQTKTEIEPGRNGAILTLGDGSKMVLDSLGNGVVASQNGATVVLSNGQLIYDAGSDKPTETEVFNTMSTPRGRQFKLKLPDGTDVWLNAASSITYPAVFHANERKVKITGEVYFEVTENKEKPFIVDVDGRATVEVLGTRFNINAYANEVGMNTTLLQGSIKMMHSGKSAILKPGQQAHLSSAGMKLIDHADLETVMAWRNGLFRFHNDPIDFVLRQMSRWYNIDVQYEQGVPDILFSGEIKRDLTLSEALELLGELGVRFRIEGNALIVIP